jgi:hypothetical protein
MAKSIRGAAGRIHSPGMFGPCNRMESTIVVSNSPKLFCLLPALPNSSGAGQGRSGGESSGEARMRAHRSNSSVRRTSPPLPAWGRLGVVGPRRCSFRSSRKPMQYPRGPTPGFFLHPRVSNRNTVVLPCCFKVASISSRSRGCRHADKVFGNHRINVILCINERIREQDVDTPRGCLITGWLRISGIRWVRIWGTHSGSKLAVQEQYKLSTFLRLLNRSLQGIAERPLPCNYNVIQSVGALSRR